MHHMKKKKNKQQQAKKPRKAALENKRSSFTLTMSPFPRPTQSHREKVPLGLWFYQWGKENLRHTSSISNYLGHFLEDHFSFTAQGNQ